MATGHYQCVGHAEMAQPESMSLEQQITTTLDSIMKLYGVPDELRKRKIEKVLNMDYQTLGKLVLQDFKQYTAQVNQQALLQELENPRQKQCQALATAKNLQISKERAI